MRKTAILLSVAVAALMGAPAWADPDTDAVRRPGFSVGFPTDPDGRSAYGLYLSGRLAMVAGDMAGAADYFAAARAVAPDATVLGGSAFTSAILAGDLNLAAEIAPSADEAPPALTEVGRLVDAVQTFARGDAAEAHAALADDPIAAPHVRAGLLVEPWIAAAAGNWDAALQEPQGVRDMGTQLIAQLQRAQLLELRRRESDADAAFKALTETPTYGAAFTVDYAEFLERRGRHGDALTIYEAAIASGDNDPRVLAGRQRAVAGARGPALPSLREGAASALRTAAGFATADKAHEFAVVYLRLAQGLNPTDQAQLQLGEALQDAGYDPLARDAFSAVQPASAAAYAAARQQVAWSLQEAGEIEAAVAEAERAFAARPQDPQAAMTLASLLLDANREEEALELLNSPVLNTHDQGWPVRFTRGAAYEQLDRIPEAEAELWTALLLSPDQPEVLNYLGYLWVDRVGRVEEGRDMLARAVAAMPESGNIQDSFGWAQYRQGEFEQAVESLEQAVSMEPANAVINDHLGDAYWQVGRKREAGFQWTRALSLDPDADLRADIEAKIERGAPEGSAW